MANRDRYTTSGRLQDVIALLQATAKRNEQAKGDQPAYWVTDNIMRNELNLGEPQSQDKKDWATVAGEHPEFFSVTKAEKPWITLIVRHLDHPEHKPVCDELLRQMIETATAIYDRERQRSLDWTIKYPIWIAAIGVLLNLVGGAVYFAMQVVR